MGDRHGGALLDLHEGLGVVTKKLPSVRWGASGGSGVGERPGCAGAGVGRIHPLGQVLDGGGELGGEVTGGRRVYPSPA